MHALIVDDSRAIRMILKKTLRAMKFDVHEAGDGKEALETLQQIDPPDVVLVDWNMPVMNGLEFVKALRARREYENVRVVMVTTETESEQMARALAAGADEYVMKPFDKAAIVDKLRLLGLET